MDLATARLPQAEAAVGIGHPTHRPTRERKLPVGVLVLQHASADCFRLFEHAGFRAASPAA